jgi:hypothetical protein
MGIDSALGQRAEDCCDFAVVVSLLFYLSHLRSDVTPEV